MLLLNSIFYFYRTLLNRFYSVTRMLMLIIIGGAIFISPAFAATPTISSISPNAGAFENSSTVTITGTNFTGVTSVKFGTQEANITSNSATQIVADVPWEMEMGSGSTVVDVIVATPQGTVTSVGGYTYVGHPYFNPSPNSGTAAGGTVVILEGENLIGVTAVEFGNAAATCYKVDSATRIFARTPAGAVGSTSISVTAAGGSDTFNGGYTYVAGGPVDPPTLVSATYNGVTGILVVQGTGLAACDDVIANKFTFTGQGGSTFTLTDTANVKSTNTTSFTLTLSATDRAAVNHIINKNGTSSTIGTTYNLAGAAGFIASFATTADTAGNGITASNANSAVNSAPTIGSLSGDSVAWAGAGNTVTLDSGGNAALTDTDLGALNSGNGDWSGASLTVQRPGTAISADTFDFNTSGALFSVSGSNLQSGGQTFATFTNTGGVLTISFTSAATAATTALVNDVARHITYRNDTPSGDASVRFNLSDGAASTTADVTVSSDTIYVTNTTDTATINVANGVSFSEAIAIAAADATGSQTIVIDSSLAGLSVSTSSVSSLSENLTLDLDPASGVTLAGGTLSIGSGFTLTVINGTGDTAAMSTALSGLGGVTKAGSGTVTLSGTNVYSGGTAASAGTLAISGGSALSNAGAVSVSSAAGLTIANNEEIGSLTGTGTVTVNNGQTLTVGNAVSSSFGGSLTGAGGLTINQSNVNINTLTLTGDNSGLSGLVRVFNYGRLIVNGENAIADNTAVTVNGNGTLTLQTNQTIGSLFSNLDTATINLGSFTLTAGGNNTNTSVYGVIAGNGNLVKQGSGTWTFESVNTYSGTTTVSAGTLSITNDSNLGSGAITLASGVTLYVGGATTIDNAIALTGAATISNTANVTIDGVISGGHNLTKAGSGVLTLARDNTYAATDVDAGTLSVSSDSNLGSDAITLAAGTTLAINGATTIDNTIALTGAATISNAANATIDGVISGSGGFNKTGSSTLTLAANNTYSGNTIVSAGGLTLTGGSSIGDGNAVSVASGATLILGGGSETIGSLLGDGNIVLGYNLTMGGNNASTTFSGVISGTGNGITKIGSGTFTLSGSNTYTGSTTVSAGTLALSGGAAISDTSAVTVPSGATLSLNASETLGSLAGAGIVSLNGFTLSSGGNNSSTTFSGGLIGSGGFAKTGSGTLTLSGSNSGTFTGDTTASGGGTLSVASDDNLGSGALSINNSTLGITGATIIDNSIALTNSATISNTAAATISNAISGSGSLSKAGSGVLSLSGTSNYAGSTTVLAGALSVAGALTGTSAVAVSSGATLTGSGSVTNLVVSNGGTLSPGNSPGVFTVNGNLQMNSGSTLAIEINGVTASTDYDQVIVNGTVSLAGNLVASHGYSAGQGDIYTIIVNDMADAITGTFSGLAEGATLTAGGNGSVLTASYIGSTGNDFTLTAPLNAAPVIGNLNGDSVTFIEDSLLVLLDANSDATVTDSDSVDLDGGNVTVSIINNRVNTEDVLSIRNEGTAGGQIGTSGLNITYGGTLIGTRTADGGTDNNDLVITLNSAATPDIIQALVRNLTYINTNTTEPTTYTRSVEVTVNDGDGGTSSGAIIDVAVVAVNDAPTLTATAATPTFTEGGAAVGLFSGTSVSTVESGQLITMFTVTVTNVTDGSDEVIHFDGSDIPLTNGFTDTSLIHGVDISVAVTGSTATLTLVRTAGLSSAQTLVDGMTYANRSINPTAANRVITITALQDDGGTANGGVDTAILNASATVTISAVNSVPVVTTTAGATAFTEGNNVASTPVTVDVGIILSDMDNTTLASATVGITNNFHAAEDVLAFTNDSATMGNISASYDAATGVLTLTSSSATATLAEWQSALASVTYTNSSETPSEATREISFVVNDGVDASAASTKEVSVTAVNDTPIISGVPLLSLNQGATYSFTPGVTDVDSVVFVFSIINQPSWATFDPVTGTLSGTPGNADVGTTTAIVITVGDGSTSTSLPAFNLTVVNVNEAPVITGTPTTTVDQDVLYSFTPTASDVDIGDVLTYSISNKPVWAAFDETTGALTGTPTNAHVGVTTGIVITVSDGTLSASLPAFNLDVVQTTDPLQPVVTAPVDIDINATGLYTPVTLRQLLSLNPSATQEQVDAILNGMASDGVSGNTCCTSNPDGLNANNVLLLPPGRHEVTWKATNAADITGVATQVVNIQPLISLSKSQIAIRGSAVEFRVLLNGKAPAYPFSVPYVIDTSTTASNSEHNLVNGVAEFTAAGQLQVAVPVQLANLSGLSDSQLVVRLNGNINASASSGHTISIREGNVPPAVVLQLSQGGINTTQVTPTGGPVTVTAAVTDLNSGDTHSYDWSASDTVLGDTDGNPVNNTRVFDPSGLSGRHQAQLTVTDSAGATANVQLYFRVVASLPVLLPDTDTDSDGINDLDEGLGDSNGNGIPDYLDNMPTSNILPQQIVVTNAYLIECDPGVRCGLGQFALVGESGGAQILDGEVGVMDGLIVDPAFDPVGGIFDFVINDLPTPGQSVRIVIPQKAPIPAGAVYRKFQNGTWVSFMENADNSIFSAPGNPGYCPPPGNTEWTTGLTQGHYCVQLNIEDGGPNDADGLVNSAVVDPGVVSVAQAVEPVPPVEPPQPPAPVKPPVEIKSKGGGAMGGLWLLLLGSLMMLKRVKPRWLALVALVITSVNTQAAPAEGTYVRVEGYSVESSLDGEKFNAALVNSGHEFTLTKYDESRNGFQLSLGYQWANSTYSELGYLDLGEVEVDLILDGGADMAAFKRDFARYYPASASGITFVQGISVELYSRVRLSLEGGVFVWQEQVDVNQANFGMEDEDGVDPLAGVRLEVDLSQSISVGLSSRRIYFDEDAVDMFSLSGRYRF